MDQTFGRRCIRSCSTDALFIPVVTLQVKERTISGAYYSSHVMQYGDIGLSSNVLFLYLGTDPANDNFTFVDENSLRSPSKGVNQRDADLIHFWDKVSFTCNIYILYVLNQLTALSCPHQSS